MAESSRPPICNLRPATSSDAESAADVWLRSRWAAVPAIPPPVHSDDEVRSWIATVLLPTHEVWIATADDGTAIGLLALGAGSVDQLYVDPDSMGHGVGSALLDLAKTQRPDGLDLWTFETNAGARRFYERHGFTAIGRTDGDNEEGAPDIRYRWSA